MMARSRSAKSWTSSDTTWSGSVISFSVAIVRGPRTRDASEQTRYHSLRPRPPDGCPSVSDACGQPAVEVQRLLGQGVAERARVRGPQGEVEAGTRTVGQSAVRVVVVEPGLRGAVVARKTLAGVGRQQAQLELGLLGQREAAV